MVISDRKVNNLEKDGIVVPTYRVLSSHELNGNISNRYEYYSITLRHHIYFLVRKIFKKIEANYDISLNNARDRHIIDKINEIMNILENDKTFMVGTKYLWVDSFTMHLIEENSYSNKSSHKDGVVERVDSSIYGGGYGLKDLWINLFTLLTYCADEIIIKSEDLLIYFDELRSLIQKHGSGYLKIGKQEAAQMLLRDKTPYIVSPSISHDLSKEIGSTVDEIIESDLAKPHSVLARDPKRTKDDILKHYEFDRSLVLSRLKK